MKLRYVVLVYYFSLRHSCSDCKLHVICYAAQHMSKIYYQCLVYVWQRRGSWVDSAQHNCCWLTRKDRGKDVGDAGKGSVWSRNAGASDLYVRGRAQRSNTCLVWRLHCIWGTANFLLHESSKYTVPYWLVVTNAGHKHNHEKSRESIWNLVEATKFYWPDMQYIAIDGTNGYILCGHPQTY